MEAVLVALLAAAPAAFVTWLIAARRLSGTVKSSEAADLWKESASIREWSRARIDALEKENHELRERIAVLEMRLSQVDGIDASE